MASQISPEWLKAHKSMSVAMRKLDKVVVNLDKHFAGMVMSRKAQKAQDGPFRKALNQLLAETTKVSKALKAIENKNNKEDVETFQSEIHWMYKEGNEVWDTDAGIMDDKKATLYAKKAIKDWNSAAKRVKDKNVKKIISKTKTPSLLEALAKTLPGISAAKQQFYGHNGKFNLAYLDFNSALGDVAKETKNVAGVLGKTKSSATKMNKAIV